MRRLLLLQIFISFQLNIVGQTITIGYPDYDPYVRPNGRGILFDLIVEIDKLTPLNIELEFIPFSRLVHQFNSNNIDAYIWGTAEEMVITEGDHRVIDLIRILNVLAFNREFNPQLEGKTIEELKELKVGYIKGDTFPESYFSGYGHTFIGANTPEQLIKMLFSGRVDVIDITQLTVMIHVEKFYGNKTKDIGVIHYKDNFAGLIISGKLDQSVIDAVEYGYKEVISSGKYREIIEGYIQSHEIIDSLIPEIEE